MASQPSQGTHVSDGLRVGPIFSTVSPPGSYQAPWTVYDISPSNAKIDNISLAAITPGAGYLTLAADGITTTQVSKFGLNNVIELDVPRAVSVTLTVGGTVGDLIVTGYDE